MTLEPISASPRAARESDDGGRDQARPAQQGGSPSRKESDFSRIWTNVARGAQRFFGLDAPFRSESETEVPKGDESDEDRPEPARAREAGIELGPVPGLSGLPFAARPSLENGISLFARPSPEAAERPPERGPQAERLPAREPRAERPAQGAFVQPAAPEGTRSERPAEISAGGPRGNAAPSREKTAAPAAPRPIEAPGKERFEKILPSANQEVAEKQTRLGANPAQSQPTMPQPAQTPAPESLSTAKTAAQAGSGGVGLETSARNSGAAAAPAASLAASRAQASSPAPAAEGRIATAPSPPVSASAQPAAPANAAPEEGAPPAPTALAAERSARPLRPASSEPPIQAAPARDASQPAAAAAQLARSVKLADGEILHAPTPAPAAGEPAAREARANVQLFSSTPSAGAPASGSSESAPRFAQAAPSAAADAAPAAAEFDAARRPAPPSPDFPAQAGAGREARPAPGRPSSLAGANHGLQVGGLAAAQAQVSAAALAGGQSQGQGRGAQQGLARQGAADTVKAASSAAKAAAAKAGDSAAAFGANLSQAGRGETKAAAAARSQPAPYVSKTPEEAKEALKILNRGLDRLSNARSNQSTVNLRVQFQQGGSLEIKLSMDKGVASAQIKTDLQGLENVIRNQWPQLAAEWEQRGVKLADPQFAQRAAGESGADAFPGRDGRRDPENELPGHPRPTAPSAPRQSGGASASEAPSTLASSNELKAYA